MKQFLMLTVAAFMIGAPLAYAQDDAVATPERAEKKHDGSHDYGDADGDGVISKSEFMASAEERFAKMDADGDGSITRDELKAAKSHMHEKRKEWREKRKDRVESEGDVRPQDAE